MNEQTKLEINDAENNTENGILEEISVLEGTVESSEQLDIDFDKLIPKMNLTVNNAEPLPTPEEPPVENLIQSEKLLGVYDEVLNLIRDEHKQVSGYIDTLADMVINGGDSTTSSKEAFINLIKIRSDLPDKMSKVADLMTRVKLKERDTYKPYLNANQTNNVVIGNTNADQKSLLDAIKKAKKKDK